MCFDLKMKTRKKNVVLLMDNSFAHKITYKTVNTEHLMLSKNSALETQTLDSGIIKSFKARFYNYQISDVVNQLSERVTIDEINKNISLKDVIIYKKRACSDDLSKTILNYWKHSDIQKLNIIVTKKL
ncbi:hypothetical protein CDIK_2437 [Cucumispora dikerogammari]|nr:hypothetical protein CDIK_2437 [Cucumispora dikerogammari]